MKASLMVFFFLEILLFVVSVLSIFVFKIARRHPALFPLLVITAVLGVVLSVLAMRQQVHGALRVFLLLTGFAPGAMFISILLHNFTSGLIMKITGRDFEDAVFLILAIFGCPAAFLVGTVGTIVSMIRNFAAR